MKKIKMIVSDLDGTLLTLDKKILKETKKNLQTARKSGLYIVLATGRTIKGALLSAEYEDYAHYVITNNGGAIYDVDKGEVLYNNTIDLETVFFLYKKYQKKIKRINFCSCFYFYQLSEEEEKVANSSIIRIESPDYLKNNNISLTHITIYLKDTNEVFYLAKEIEKTYPFLKAIIMQDSFSQNKWIDVVLKDVNKINALTKLTNDLNIDLKDVVAFGDGLNDISMVKNVGYGVAVSNALDEVKRVSKEITDSNQENGVGKWVQKYLDKMDVD